MIHTHVLLFILATPATFDVLQARDELYEYYRKQHRSPGAPKMIPVLSHTNIVSHQCKPFEELRREDVTRSRLFVKIFFNDELVSQTKKRYNHYIFTLFLCSPLLLPITINKSIVLIFVLLTYMVTTINHMIIAVPILQCLRT